MKSQNRLIDPKYLKTYDLITYKAKQTRTRGKYRPFLITGIDSTKQTITIIPITHSAPNPKSPYSRFHYEVDEKINQGINQATQGDPKQQNYLDVQDQKEIPFSKFYKNGLPEMLGSIKTFSIKRRDIEHLEQGIQQSRFEIVKAYQQYNREMEQNGTVVNFQERREKKEILPKSDLKKMQIAKDLGFRPTDPRAYDPAIQKKQKQKYQRPSSQQIKRDYGPDL